MPIIRVKHDRNFVVIRNETVLDSNLTLAERGFLAAMLTFPDDWRFNLRDLGRRLGINKGTVGKYLSALDRVGYCQISKARSATGTYEVEYVVREIPVRENRTGYQSGNTGPVKPDIPRTNDQKRGGN